MSFRLSSKAVEPESPIPSKYTCDGADLSPDLTWSDPPNHTRGFALICDDPDAPMGTWVHWVLYGLSADVNHLPEAFPKDPQVSSPQCVQGTNDFRKTGYGGPCPPKGPAHRYYFKLYALDENLKLSPKLTKADLLRAIDGHVLGTAELMGTYQRK